MPDDVLAGRGASLAEFQAAYANVFADASLDAATDPITLEWIDSPVGPLLAGTNQRALLLLEFTRPQGMQSQLQSIRRRYGAAVMGGGSCPLAAALRAQLAEYFAGQRREFVLPLEYAGTAFQERVWSLLLGIPYGTTWSYLEMATRLGDPKATRAVGMANGMNHIAIVIPCHRVVNANGALGGYGGGLWRKRLLLDLERGQGGLAF